MSQLVPKNDMPLWISGGLVVGVLFVFGQTLQHDFLSYDDGHYITYNEMVRQGLTWESLRWALTAVVASMWHPLTLISHMIDVELFGMRPGLHHLVNVVFHAANAVLVFHVFRRMTGAMWASAILAALFALHPLRAESVAWASERKDVLSAFFWLLAMLAYLRYVERRSAKRYAWVMLCMALGLLAKPMVVTLPCALLLLDFWPLKRFRAGLPDEEGRAFGTLFVEKLPLFGLSVAASLASIWAQGSGGAVGGLERYPLSARIANALVAYGMYLWTTFVPIDLAPIYPHFGAGTEGWRVAVSAAILLAVTLAALFLWKRCPYLFVGWFWFLGTLVPVIGLVQIGSNARADRYTYLPHLGLLLALVWLGWEAVRRWPRLRVAAGGLAAVAVVALAARCYDQVAYWRDNVTLFEHNVRVAPRSAKAYYNLGIGYAVTNRPRKAEKAFREAVERNPHSIDMRRNLGAALLELGKPEEAEVYFREIVREDPYEPEYHVNLAIALYRQGKYGEAIFRAEEALRIDPDYEKAHQVIERARRSLEPDFSP